MRATNRFQNLEIACAQGVMKKYSLREEAGAEPQTYAIGLKEVWEVSCLSASTCQQSDPLSAEVAT